MKVAIYTFYLCENLIFQWLFANIAWEVLRVKESCVHKHTLTLSSFCQHNNIY